LSGLPLGLFGFLGHVPHKIGWTIQIFAHTDCIKIQSRGTDSSIKELSAQEKKTGEAGCLAKKKISKQLHRFSFILFFLDFLRG
jgi:hypothetical protein